MKMKYIKPESTVIEVQSENCMQDHFSKGEVTNPDGSSDPIQIEDEMPGDAGWQL